MQAGSQGLPEAAEQVEVWRRLPRGNLKRLRGCPKGLCSLGLLSLDLPEKCNPNASRAHGAPSADRKTFLT